MADVIDINQPIHIKHIRIDITKKTNEPEWYLEFIINDALSLTWDKTITGKDIDQVIAEEIPILAMALKEAEINPDMS